MSDAFGFAQHFSDIHRRLYPSGERAFSEFIDECLFLVEVTFKPDTVLIFEPKYVLQAHYSHPLAEYEKLCFQVAARLRSKADCGFTALTYAWVDFEGATEATKLNFTNTRKPYVRALAILYPNVATKLITLISDPMLLRERAKIARVNIAHFNSSCESLETCIARLASGYLGFDAEGHEDVREGLRAVFIHNCTL